MTIALINFKNQVLSHYNWLNRIDRKRHWLRGRAYHLAKRVIDLAFVFLVLPLLFIVFAFCALLIKLESPTGPIFFVQMRTGKGGRRFRMYKFRTMVVNAEEIKKQFVPVTENGELTGPLKLEHDPRVTRVGRILRKTSLDELPQVINILKGEMSWVGPRPTSFGPQTYSLWHTERLDVTPGITGLWQLYGRGDVNFDNWLYWDTLYIEKQCIWLDLQIMLRTVLAVVDRRGAR